MVKQKVFEEFNHGIKADENHAQILVKIVQSKKTFEELKTIIEESGAHIVESKNGLSNWLLLKLEVGDMRGIVLRLIECGFLEIKGYNASSLKT